jgi:hypothetical protein
MARNQKLSATITIGAALQQSVKRNLDVVGRGLKNVGDEIRTVTARQKELDKERRVLERQGQAVDHLDKEYQELNRTLERLADRQRRLQAVQNSIGRVGGAFGNMTREVTRAARTTAIAVAGVGTAIFGLANSTATLGDDVAKTAGRLGMGIEALQEFRYAAERSGVASSAFDSSIETMNKNIGMAGMGLGRARKAFDELGLSAERLAASSPEQRFEIIAQRLSEVDDQAQRAALAAQIFGSEGAALTVMMQRGAAGVRELRDDARSLGFVLSEQAARDAETFKDALLDAQLGAQGLKNTVGAELMPVVTGVMQDFTGWLRQNREPVTDFARRFADGIGAAVPVIGEVVSGLAEISAKVGSVIASVADMVGGWENFGMVIGALFASKAIIAIGGFVLSIGQLAVAVGALVAPAIVAGLPVVAGGLKAVGLALAANPIGAALLAIGLGAAAIIANWDKIRPALQPVIDWLSGAVEAVQENAIQPFIELMTDGVAGIKAAWEDVKAALSSVLDWIGSKFDAIGRKIQPVIDGLRWVRDKAGGAVGAVGDFFTSDEPQPSSRGRNVSRRAVGGSFLPGATLVGERGPELRFESRAGFIATNPQLRGMADMADRIRGVAVRGVEGAAQQIQQALTIASGAIVINAAPGMDPRAIADTVLGELQRRQRGALFDGGAI